MSRFNLHLKHDAQFEEIIWHLCVELFGAQTKKFAPGKDRGRDALFEGTARAFPSDADGWKGKTVIQAKHTANVTASCSDNDFSRLLKDDEVPRINALRAANELDHYICFTNRKMTGVVGRDLELELRALTGITDLQIQGLEYIEGTLTRFPHLIDTLGLRMLAPGLQIHPQDLETLIQYFDQHVDVFSANAVTRDEAPYFKPSLPDKNTLNQLGEEYFQSAIVEDSMAHFKIIEEFLSNPRNQAWKRKYTSVAAQFKNAYLAHRAEFPAFEHVFTNIFDRLKLRDQLPGMDGLIYTFLHYMYCNCDLGRKTPNEGT